MAPNFFRRAGWWCRSHRSPDCHGVKEISFCSRRGLPSKTALILISMAYLNQIPSAVAQNIPPNAQEYGSSWTCNYGYKKNPEGTGCVKIDVPPNAQAYGSSWTCNIGFKKVGNSCQEMTPKEKAEQIEQINLRMALERSRAIEVEGDEFSLNDVERKCEVYRYSENYGDIECSGSELRIVERKCEAYFGGYGESEGDIECSGSDLKPIERHCTASMYSDDYAEIDC